MPRIRTIKPEFCTSEQVAECSTNGRLLFVCMWMFCDDAGRHPANLKRLKMEVFPGDSFTDKQMQGFVDELIRVGLLVEYQHENVAYWQVTGWKHQRIDKPSYKYGPFDQNGRPLPIVEHSRNGSRPIDERSHAERSGVEGSLPEGNGEDGGIGDKSPTPHQPSGHEFILANCSMWQLPLTKLAEYRKSYPELDHDRELRAAAQWLLDRPKRRKTAQGIPAFLGSWLNRAQDQPQQSALQRTPSTFAQQRLQNTQRAMEDFANG